MRKEKGITLIALVITIIVLLILAGVTIATLTGDNGILQKANDAKIETIEAEGIERIKLAVMASHDENGINTTLLANNLRQINGLTDTNNQEITEIVLPKSVKLNNVKYDIKEDGTVVNNNSILPAEYQQVEYLQNEIGTTYIDLGFKIDNSTDVEVKGRYLRTGTGQLFGYDQLLQIPNNSHVDFRYNGITYISSAKWNEVHKYRVKGNQCYIDDVLINTFSESSFESVYNATLFSVRLNNNQTGTGGGCRIYSFTYRKDNNTILNLIPALDSNGRPCMYDTVAKYPFYNQGSGEFIAGPEV